VPLLVQALPWLPGPCLLLPLLVQPLPWLPGPCLLLPLLVGGAASCAPSASLLVVARGFPAFLAPAFLAWAS